MALLYDVMQNCVDEGILFKDHLHVRVWSSINEYIAETISALFLRAGPFPTPEYTSQCP